MKCEIPGFVVRCERQIERHRRDHDRIVRRYFPAIPVVHTLIRFFKTRLRIEKALCKTIEVRRMDEEWYVKYSPNSFLGIMECEARFRVYGFLILALKAHAAAFSRRPDPEKFSDPRRRAGERGRFWRAPDALKAVGSWWIKANHEAVRPCVTPKERRAFELCAQIYRLSTKNLNVNIKDFTAYLGWTTRHLKGTR